MKVVALGFRGDVLDRVVPLDGVSVGELRALMGADRADPLVGASFPVREELRSSLEARAGKELDESLDWFVEVEQEGL